MATNNDDNSLLTKKVNEPTMPVTIIRTSDAMKKQISISLSTKLSALRKQLSQEDMFGVLPQQQRLFFMGRELKNGGRPLSAIGLGSFDQHVIHLHVRPMTTATATTTTTTTTTAAAAAVATSSSKGIEQQPLPKRRRIHPPSIVGTWPTRRQQVVSNQEGVECIDLLESDAEVDDDVDDDDDKGILYSSSEVEIEEEEEDDGDDDNDEEAVQENNTTNNTDDESEVLDNPNECGVIEIV